MDTQDNLSIAKELYECFNRRDFKGAARHTDTNTEIVNIPAKVTLKGSDAIAQFMEGWAKGLPDSKVKINNIVSSGDVVVCEFTGTGTHTGTFSTPDGDIMPTNKKLDIQLCDVMKFRNGKLLSLHTYYDFHSIQKQLGILQEAGSRH